MAAHVATIGILFGEECMIAHTSLTAKGNHDSKRMLSRVGRRGFLFSPRVIPGIIFVVDALVILLGVVTVALVVQASDIVMPNPYVFVAGGMALSASLAMEWRRLGMLDAVMNPLGRATSLLVVAGLAIMLVLSATYLRDELLDSSPAALLLLGGAAFLTVVALRRRIPRLIDRLWRRGIIGTNLAVIGTHAECGAFLHEFRRQKPNFTILAGVFSDSEPHGRSVGHDSVLGDVEQAVAAVRAGLIDDIVIAAPPGAGHAVARTIERLRVTPTNIYATVDEAARDKSCRQASRIYPGIPLIEVQRRPIADGAAVLKALEDFLLAGAITILIAPLLALIAIAIKLDSPGPVFFKQKRLGLNNQEFLIWKFRTMHHRGIPEARVQQATRDDPRITRIGRILRRTSLDELPQLFNVLNGSMSIVGPRPHALSHNEEYGGQVRDYYARHKVKPGITGWAQVNGLRGETEVIEKMEARVRHDIEYIENWSLGLDLRILLKTALVVFFQKSAY